MTQDEVVHLLPGTLEVVSGDPEAVQAWAKRDRRRRWLHSFAVWLERKTRPPVLHIQGPDKEAEGDQA